MQIEVEHRDGFSILHLRGEFDARDCTLFLKAIDGLIATEITRVALDLSRVELIDFRALLAILEAMKTVGKQGGTLFMLNPSATCREAMERTGLDRLVVPTMESDDLEVFLRDDKEVLFAPRDPELVARFIPSDLRARSPDWRGIGRIAKLGKTGLRFNWNGGQTGLSPTEMTEMLQPGTELIVTLRMPFAQEYYGGALTICAVEERSDGVRVTASSGEDGEGPAGVPAWLEPGPKLDRGHAIAPPDSAGDDRAGDIDPGSVGRPRLD